MRFETYSDPNTGQTDMPVLSEVLQQLNDTGVFPPKRIELVLGVAKGMGYKYLGGSDMPFSKFLHLFQHCGSIDAQRALITMLLEGTGWVAEHIDAKRDINGDGVVDTTDLVQGGIDANASLATLLQSLLLDAHARRSIAAVRAEKITHHINLTITRLLEVRQAVSFLNETRRSK